MGIQGQCRSGRLRPLIYQSGACGNANVEKIAQLVADVMPARSSKVERLAHSVIAQSCDHNLLPVIEHLDWVVWEQARTQLSSDQITAIINRLNHSHGHCYAISEYAAFVSALIATVLSSLDEVDLVDEPYLTMLLLLSETDSDALKAQADQSIQDEPTFQSALSRLPGFAFALMIRYSNDSQESFMARDAFWRAMLGS